MELSKMRLTCSCAWYGFFWGVWLPCYAQSRLVSDCTFWSPACNWTTKVSAIQATWTDFNSSNLTAPTTVLIGKFPALQSQKILCIICCWTYSLPSYSLWWPINSILSTQETPYSPELPLHLKKAARRLIIERLRCRFHHLAICVLEPVIPLTLCVGLVQVSKLTLYPLLDSLYYDTPQLTTVDFVRKATF